MFCSTICVGQFSFSSNLFWGGIWSSEPFLGTFTRFLTNWNAKAKLLKSFTFLERQTNNCDKGRVGWEKRKGSRESSVLNEHWSINPQTCMQSCTTFFIHGGGGGGVGWWDLPTPHPPLTFLLYYAFLKRTCTFIDNLACPLENCICFCCTSLWSLLGVDDIINMIEYGDLYPYFLQNKNKTKQTNKQTKNANYNSWHRIHNPTEIK